MLSLEMKESIGVFRHYVKGLSDQIETTRLEPNVHEDSSLVKGLKDIFNKLTLLNLTNSRSIVAITGLQGAQKTRLINKLYDLEEGILPEKVRRVKQMTDKLRERHLEYSGAFDEIGELEQIQYSLRKVNQQCRVIRSFWYDNPVFL